MRIGVFFHCLLFSVYFLGSVQAQCVEKIDPVCISIGNNKKDISYLVFLNNRVDFSPSKSFSKKAKANFVYNALIKQADISQPGLIAFLKENHVDYRPFYIVNAILVTSDLAILHQIACRNDVTNIVYDSDIKLENYIEDRLPKSERSIFPEWGISKIMADSVWKLGYKGQGVVVGSLDTGVDWEVSPLKSKYRGYVSDDAADHSISWHDAIHEINEHYPDTIPNPCGLSTTVPCDDHNHGTHTVGTMVGQDSANFIGVAPDAKWVAWRNMDRGWGKLSTYIECFEWMLAPYSEGLDPDPNKSPDIINNSYYCSQEEGCGPEAFTVMEMVVKTLQASGIFVSVSAGNEGPKCGTVTGPPGFFESSFSIGATDELDTIAGFSSRGPVVIDSSFRMKPNVVAPGVRVRSVIRNGLFASFGGTSMSSPHNAGVVALMLSANPSLSGHIDIIANILEQTAVPLTIPDTCLGHSGMEIPNPFYGFGRINALEAVKAAIITEVNEVEMLDADVLAYPNPTSNLLFIQSKKIMRNVTVFDVLGHVVLNQDVDAIYTPLDISSVTQGLYFVRIKLGDQYLTKAILKE